MLYCILFGAGFLVFGLIFSTGRLLDHIPGWANMPAQEQRKIRVRPLCRNIGSAICLAGGLLLLGGLFPPFRDGGMRLAMVGWFVLCIADLVFISKSGRYVQGGKAR